MKPLSANRIGKVVLFCHADRLWRAISEFLVSHDRKDSNSIIDGVCSSSKMIESEAVHFRSREDRYQR